MDTGIGLPPGELIEVFNQMYLDVLGKSQDKISWELADLSAQIADGIQPDMAGLLRVLDTIVAAMRDGMVMVVYENNRIIAEQLRAAGVSLPEPEPEAGEDEDGPTEENSES